MAKTAAQRQAEYRRRCAQTGRDGNGERRLNLWVSTEVALGLARLARRAGVTQREMVEQMVKAADERVLAGLEMDTPQWDEYFGTRWGIRVARIASGQKSPGSRVDRLERLAA